MESDEPLQILTQSSDRYRAWLTWAERRGVLLNLFCEIYVSWQESVLTPRCIRRQERQQENRGERGAEEKTNIPDLRPWLQTQHTCNVSSAFNEASTLPVHCAYQLCLRLSWFLVMTRLDGSLEPLVVIFILCNNQHTPELLWSNRPRVVRGWVFPFAQHSQLSAVKQSDRLEIIRPIGVLT